jgi:hypothetical protein
MRATALVLSDVRFVADAADAEASLARACQWLCWWNRYGNADEALAIVRALLGNPRVALTLPVVCRVVAGLCKSVTEKLHNAAGTKTMCQHAPALALAELLKAGAKLMRSAPEEERSDFATALKQDVSALCPAAPSSFTSPCASCVACLAGALEQNP